MQRQNTRGGYRIGPGASSLLLIFVAVCLTTVGILTLISALADSRMSDRSAERIQAYYNAATRAQREIGVLDGQIHSARNQSRGDLFAYQALVQNLAGDQIAMTIDQADEDNMRIVFEVPMGIDNHLEVELHVPLAFDGPRYKLVRHVAVNNAPWEPKDPVELFMSLPADDIMSGGDVEPIDLDDDTDSSDPGFIGEGQSIQPPEDG